MLASTLRDPEQNAFVMRQLGSETGVALDEMLELDGQRYKLVTGALDEGESRQGLRYVLLSSTEQRLSAVEHTRLHLFVRRVGVEACPGAERLHRCRRARCHAAHQRERAPKGEALTRGGLEPAGYLVAVLALMETPAILTGLMLAQRAKSAAGAIFPRAALVE